MCNDDDDGPKKLATPKTRPTLFAVQLQMARANTQSKRRKQFTMTTTTTATRLRESTNLTNKPTQRKRFVRIRLSMRVCIRVRARMCVWCFINYDVARRAFFALFSNLGEEICSWVHTHTYTYIFFFFQTFRHQIIKKHMQRPFKGNCACVRAFERARSLYSFFFSFLLSLFLLCAICKLRNCRRSKMCHSSSWFFAAALSSSLSLSFSLYAIYLFFLLSICFAREFT